MIFDSVKNIKEYNLSENILQALDVASKYTVDNYNTERVDLKNGDYILPNEYKTQIKVPIVMEAHRKYIDVMYVVEGSEMIMVTNTSNLTNVTSEYDATSDYLLAETKEPVSTIVLKAGDFIILYPQDAHCPACALEQDTPVKKVICKIKI